MGNRGDGKGWTGGRGEEGKEGREDGTMNFIAYATGRTHLAPADNNRSVLRPPVYTDR